MTNARLEIHVRDECWEYNFSHWPVHRSTIDKARAELKRRHVKADEPYEIYLIIKSKANDEEKLDK